MQNQEARKKANTISIALSSIGVLFFISSGLGVFPWKYAVFGGIACFIIAGAVRRSMTQ
jgi:hypothetical protein